MAGGRGERAGTPRDRATALLVRFPLLALRVLLSNPYLLSVSALLTAAAPALAAPARSDRDGLSSIVSLGFDSFSEKYSIEETDTLDVSHELRSSVGLSYRRFLGDPGPASGTVRSSVFEMEDVLTVSDAALRNRWDVDLDLNVRRGDRLSLSNELSSRRIDPGGDLNLSSDYLQDVARFSYRARLSEGYALVLRDRFELIDFDEEDAYEMDYRRNEAGGGLSFEPGIDGSLDLDYTRGDRVVPDSSAIDYHEHRVHATWWQGLGLANRIEVQGDVERRRYQDEIARPGYVLIVGDAIYALRASDRLELRFREELEITRYDAQTQVYYDRLLQLAGLEAAVDVTLGVELGLEPRYSLLRSEEGAGEDYDEWSAVLSGDWLRIDRLWFTGSAEVGWRNYRESEDDSLNSIFSDYTVVRTNLFATFDLGSRTTWNLFFSYEPERHADENDDSTTALFSTELMLKF